MIKIIKVFIMVDYEKEYDKFGDVPNNIDYGSWYEYDNFQDFIDGKNAMDLTEGEIIDYSVLNLPEDSILDFNELIDDESIYREEYLNALIEERLEEKEAFEEYIKSFEEDGVDYEHLESIFFDNEIDVPEFDNELSEDEMMEIMGLKMLIANRLKDKGELDEEFLKKISLENEMGDIIDDFDFEEYFDDFEYDEEIDEKYYEHIAFLDDELHYKMIETNKKNDDDDLFHEVTDYGDNQFEE